MTAQKVGQSKAKKNTCGWDCKETRGEPDENAVMIFYIQRVETDLKKDNNHYWNLIVKGEKDIKMTLDLAIRVLLQGLISTVLLK